MRHQSARCLHLLTCFVRLCLPLFLLTIVPAWAQFQTSVPRMIKFSGTVKDVQGNSQSGPVNITFSFYQDQHGGSPLWLETQVAQADAQGHYSVYLGATNPGGLPQDLFVFGEARWLGVQVEGQPEAPRTLLLSVPYALKAGDAETIGGLPPSAFVLAAPSAASPAAAAAAPSASPDSSGPPANPAVTGLGTVSFIPLWDTTSDIVSSVLFQSGTGTAAKVGINTTTPSTTLDVKGSGTIRGSLTMPTTGTATATAGKNSQPVVQVASSFNSSTHAAVNETFRLQAEPAANNTANPSGTLNLLFGAGTASPTETGLKISNTGIFIFADTQTFPGTGTLTGLTAGAGMTGGGTSGDVTLGLTTSCSNGQVLQWNGTTWACTTISSGGTITGVTAGTDLSGGGTTGTVTLNVDTTKVPQLNTANTFTGNQTVSGNLTASGTVTGNTFQIGSNLFGFGSFANSNAFLGFSGTQFTTGTSNTATGAQALSQNGAGSQNTATGSSALLSNTSGSANTAIGTGALNLNSTGSNNTASGSDALQANTNGGYNTADGIFALFLNTTGSFNSALGYLAGPDSAHPNLNNSTAIGAMASVTQSNSMVLGSIVGVNGAGSSTNVGIGTTAPAFTLDVHGTGNFTGPITFASGQTFPNTISGVTAGTALTGGGTTGNVTLNLDTTKIPQLNVSNTFVGDQTVNGNLSSTGLMTGSGFQIGSNLFAFGSYANSNAFLGFSGNTTTTGTSNTANGYLALSSVTSGGSNTANGWEALSSNSTGTANTASGVSALRFNTTGSFNMADGQLALFLNTTGGSNTASGSDALPHNTTGSYNTASGSASLYSSTTGNGNTAIGEGALSNNNTGSNNTALGYGAGPADVFHANLSNATAIGANAEVDQSNTMVLGSINGLNGATADTLVGIGTTTPAAKLDVHGTANFTGLITFAAGQTFPGAGTITGITPGTALTGGGSSGSVTLNVDTTKVVTGITAGTDLTGGGTGGVQTLSLDTTKVPQLAAANTFTNNQTVTGNLTATGVLSGSSYQIGSNLFAFGSFANSNAFLGFAGNTTTSGLYNTGVGYQTLLANTSGSTNTASGDRALTANTTGYSNIADGVEALDQNTTGFGNTAVGYLALSSNIVGTYNTSIGFESGPCCTNLTNATTVGADAEVDESNALVLGSINGVNGATASTNVGIGTTTPFFPLHVERNDNSGAGIQIVAENQSTSGASFAVFNATSDSGVTAEMVADGLGTGPLATPSGYFGTYTNQPVGFITGNVLRMFFDTTGKVGINTKTPDNALSVNGSADKTGGGSWGTFSDGRLKNLNGSFQTGLSEILKLHPIRYRYKEENAMGIRDHDEHIGFVAQDVQKVIPEAVTENSRGYLLVNNDPILWAMLNAIQEQQQQIREQRQQIRTQQRQIASLNGKLGVLEAALRTTGRAGKSSAVVHSLNTSHQLPSAEVSCTRQRGK